MPSYPEPAKFCFKLSPLRLNPPVPAPRQNGKKNKTQQNKTQVLQPLGLPPGAIRSSIRRSSKARGESLPWPRAPAPPASSLWGAPVQMAGSWVGLCRCPVQPSPARPADLAPPRSRPPRATTPLPPALFPRQDLAWTSPPPRSPIGPAPGDVTHEPAPISHRGGALSPPQPPAGRPANPTRASPGPSPTHFKSEPMAARGRAPHGDGGVVLGSHAPPGVWKAAGAGPGCGESL